MSGTLRTFRATSSSSATASTTASATATCATSAPSRPGSTAATAGPHGRDVRLLGRCARSGQRVRRRLRPRLPRALPQPARHRLPRAQGLRRLALVPTRLSYDVWDAAHVPGNEFVVGYGLDYRERYRNLRDIGTLAPRVYGGDSRPART